jgi:Na+-translocating ferredoxin:NAD+ oxidoreductase RNF subunit RnfB
VVVVRIVYAVASVAGLGIVLGLGLAVASRLLAVRRDERVEAIEKALPGANCGACGFAGCAAYAAEIVGGEVALDLCTVGGPDVAAQVAEIMGVEYESGAGTRRVPQVHCRGAAGNAQRAFEYEGVVDCVALNALFGGDKVCKYGCLGLGTCIRVCPVQAISYDSEGLVWVNKELCIACGQCVKVCPTGVMQWLPFDADYLVACNSRDKGGRVRKYCKVGCIACKMCEKKSPEGGYKIEDNLCRIDFQASGERAEGAAACPTKCIVEHDVHPRS